MRSLGLPIYRSFPLGLPDAAVERALARFRPHVVRLASPICLGAVGLRAARKAGIPTVGVYQTDIGGFARQYGVRADLIVDKWVGRIHRRCDRTLVPSRTSYAQLGALGVPDLHVWRRGVSLDLFDPGRRDRALHAQWSGGKDVVVGYVGRLAAEKEIRRLVALAQIPDIRLVMIGDGPARGWLEERLPGATFTGMLGGDELARAFASLDVFVHPGTSETFCQTVQEAQASGVPVVAAAAGGPLDLVEPGETGLLFDPADPASLVDAVATFAASAELRDRVAATALRAVATQDFCLSSRERAFCLSRYSASERSLSCTLLCCLLTSCSSQSIMFWVPWSLTARFCSTYSSTSVLTASAANVASRAVNEMSTSRLPATGTTVTWPMNAETSADSSGVSSSFGSSTAAAGVRLSILWKACFTLPRNGPPVGAAAVPFYSGTVPRFSFLMTRRVRSRPVRIRVLRLVVRLGILVVGVVVGQSGDLR